jgi:hypothetical protein
MMRPTLAQQRYFRRHAEYPDQDGAAEQRDPEITGKRQQRKREVGAQHVERTVRKVGDAHQAED